MKKKYSEFYKPSEEKLKTLWIDSHFVFDANTLLNLYMYSEKTVDDFWNVFDNIKDRIWLSFQAGYEFHKNRPARIRAQQVLFDKTIASIKNISKSAESELAKNFKSIREHPSIEEKVILKEIGDFFKGLIKNINQKKEAHPDLFIDEDNILLKITELFDDKVGDGFSEDELNEIFKEGEKRYIDEIPPGFADSKDKKGNEKFGDLVIWKEILEHAKDESISSIIFITDDAKEDWWRVASGRTIGPHPSLIKEFTRSTKKDYHQYSSEQFLRFAKINSINVSDESISETKRVAKTIGDKNNASSFLLNAFNKFDPTLTSSGLSQKTIDEITGRSSFAALEEAININKRNLATHGFTQEKIDEITGRSSFAALEDAININQRNLATHGYTQEKIDEITGRSRFAALEEALSINKQNLAAHGVTQDQIDGDGSNEE